MRESSPEKPEVLLFPLLALSNPSLPSTPPTGNRGHFVMSRAMSRAMSPSPRPLLSVTFHLHHLLLLPAETWWRRPVAAVEGLQTKFASM